MKHNFGAPGDTSLNFLTSQVGLLMGCRDPPTLDWEVSSSNITIEVNSLGTHIVCGKRLNKYDGYAVR